MLKLLLLLIICVGVSQVFVSASSLNNGIGTFFLGPDLYSYDQVFGYYYLVKSTNANYFQRESLGGMSHGYLSDTVRKIYKQAGASNFKPAYYRFTLPDGYSLITVTNMPNEANLYLIINSESRGLNTSTNTYGEPIIKCLSKTASVYDCLPEAQQTMIDSIVTGTNIILPKIEYMSNGEFAGILVGSIIGFFVIILIVCCCWGRCKRDHYKYDDYSTL